MYVYNLDDLLRIRDSLRVSLHALIEAYKDGLSSKDVVHAIWNGEVIERYPERNRVLIKGPTTSSIPLHIVCDYADREEIVAVTVYIPSRDTWAADLVRRPTGQA